MAKKETIILERNKLLQIFDQISEQHAEVDPKLVRTTYAILDFITFTLATTEAYLARYGLSQGRFVILMLLSQFSEQTWTPGKLADSIGVTRATVTGLLNVLERDNWIERLPYSKDGRMKVVILTQTGHTKITEFIPEHLERISKILANFSDEELELLLGLLGKAKNAFSSQLT